MEDNTVKRRPGRKLGAERRRVAKEIIRRFYNTDTFAMLPSEVRIAILELCPEQDSHPTEKLTMIENVEPPVMLKYVSSWR